jgi:hypothetical protein
MNLRELQKINKANKNAAKKLALLNAEQSDSPKEPLVPIPGEKGADGKEGKQGPKGDKGEAGNNGKDAKDGKAGEQGKDGSRGLSGATGGKGEDGKDGKDGNDIDATAIKDNIEIIEGDIIELSEEIEKLDSKVKKSVKVIQNGGGRKLTVQEEDGSPSAPVSTLKFANGSVTINPDGSASIASLGGGGGGSDVVVDETFVPTNGQTAFVLSTVPLNNSDILMLINNIAYIVGQNFTISGTTITWLDDFTLETTDIVVIRYTT